MNVRRTRAEIHTLTSYTHMHKQAYLYSTVCTTKKYTLYTQHVQCRTCTIMSMTHTTLVDKNTTSRGLVTDSVFFWWQISRSLVCVRSWRVIMPTTYKWRKKREVLIEERTLDSYQLTIPEAFMTGRCLSPIVRKRLNTWGRRAWCDVV